MQNEMRDRLVELIKQIQFDFDEECVACIENGYKAQPMLEEFFADHLIANDVVIAIKNKDVEEEKMVYFPFPIDCEKCSKAIKEMGVCEGLNLLYDGKHPKYTKTQDWEFMCDTCPHEVHGRKYREKDDKDYVGKTMFFSEEEAEKALKEGYSDERIYRA